MNIFCLTLLRELQGQKRPVEIVRLRMKDSIESRMAQMIERKYGKRHTGEDGNENTGGNDDDAKADDGEASAITVATANTLVGSVNNDKAAVVGAEFDLLFGWTAEVTPAEVASSDAIPEPASSTCQASPVRSSSTGSL